MKLILAAVLAYGLVAAPAQSPSPSVDGTWRVDTDNHWSRGVDDERWVSIELQHDSNNNGIGLRARDVPALADGHSDGPVHFTLRRDAGTFTFDGRASGSRAAGTFRFVADPQFAPEMRTLGVTLSSDDVWRFALHDIDRTYVGDFRKAGYHLDADALIKSRIHGATPQFAQDVKQQGLGSPSIDDLVTMRIHGVTPEFIRAMRERGYKGLAIDDLVKMRIHGVTPEFVQSMTDAGYQNLDLDTLVKMRIHGVTPDFVRELSDLGYRNLSVDDLVKLRIHGVTPEYIKEMRAAGYGGVTAETLVTFRIHGVDADLVSSAKSHGFNNLSADDLVDLAIHGRRWLNAGR